MFHRILAEREGARAPLHASFTLIPPLRPRRRVREGVERGGGGVAQSNGASVCCGWQRGRSAASGPVADASESGELLRVGSESALVVGEAETRARGNAWSRASAEASGEALSRLAGAIARAKVLEAHASQLMDGEDLCRLALGLSRHGLLPQSSAASPRGWRARADALEQALSEGRAAAGGGSVGEGGGGSALSGGVDEAWAWADAIPELARVDYLQFCSAAQESGARAQLALTPAVFLSLERDPLGLASARAVFQYACVWTATAHLRIQLSTYAAVGEDALDRDALAAFVRDVVAASPRLGAQVSATFLPTYADACAHRIVFECARHARSGGARAPVADVAASAAAAQLLGVAGWWRWAEPEDPRGPADWMAPETVRRVYLDFCRLDKDRNGSLSEPELLRFRQGELTETFLRHVAARHASVRGELGFSAFLDLVYATTEPAAPRSARWLFSVLDTRHRGLLLPDDVRLFFRGVQDALRASGVDAPKEADFVTEMLDLLHPARPPAIALDDVARAPLGFLFLAALTDVNAFWAYENRQKLPHKPPSDADLAARGPVHDIVFTPPPQTPG
jgi:hypothetical protein